MPSQNLVRQRYYSTYMATRSPSATWNPFSKATTADVRRLWRWTLPVHTYCPWEPASVGALYTFWLRGALVYIGRTRHLPTRSKGHEHAPAALRKAYDTVRWMPVADEALVDVEAAFIAFFLPEQNHTIPQLDEAAGEIILRAWGFSVAEGALAERLRGADGRRPRPTPAGLRVLWDAIKEPERRLLAKLAAKGPIPRSRLALKHNEIGRIAIIAARRCRASSPIVTRGFGQGRSLALPTRYRGAVIRMARATGIL